MTGRDLRERILVTCLLALKSAGSDMSGCFGWGCDGMSAKYVSMSFFASAIWMSPTITSAALFGA